MTEEKVTNLGSSKCQGKKKRTLAAANCRLPLVGLAVPSCLSCSGFSVGFAAAAGWADAACSRFCSLNTDEDKHRTRCDEAMMKLTPWLPDLACMHLSWLL